MQQQTEHLGGRREWLAQNLGVVVVVIGALGLAAGAAVLAIYRFHFAPPVSNTHADWGTFGDFFGGTLNPIFGFLGLIALLLTLWVQSRELAVSREELRASRIAMEQSAEAQQASQGALNRQAVIQQVQLEFELTRLEITRLQAKIQAIEMESRGYNQGAADRFAKETTAVVEEMAPHIDAARAKLSLI
jgi:hypothetical protein